MGVTLQVDLSNLIEPDLTGLPNSKSLDLFDRFNEEGNRSQKNYGIAPMAPLVPLLSQIKRSLLPYPAWPSA